MDNLPIAEFWEAIDENDLRKLRQLVADYPELLTARVDSDGSTCLHDATKYGTYELVEELLRFGADPNSTASGRTPLHCAVLLAKVPTIKLLLEHGADPNILSEDGETPMLIAARSRQLFDEDDEQVVPDLLERYGARLDIHSAATLGRFETVQKILETNKSAIQESPRSEEILLHLGFNSTLELWHLLLEHGANPNGGKDLGVSPLIYILSSVPCSFDILKLLLDYRADPDAIVGDPPRKIYDYAKHLGHPQKILNLILQYSKG